MGNDKHKYQSPMQLHHYSLASCLWVIGLLSPFFATGFVQTALAQSFIVPDETLGAERSQLEPFGPSADIITGGAARGQNLFHSFEEFNVDAGRFVWFETTSPIQSIFSRVTGENPSNILGFLGTLGDDADLYLINPNGVLFGPNATLQVNDSFLATTADAVLFGEQAFRATDANAVPSQLTIDPSAFLFTQPQIAPIQGNQAFLNLFFGGQSFILLGGEIDLQETLLFVREGAIGLNAIAEPGTVDFDASGFSLTIPENLQRADITLDNQSNLFLIGGQGIRLQGDNITLANGSNIATVISAFPGFEQRRAGDINIEATGELTIAAQSFVGSGLFGDFDGDGSSGNIVVSGQNINLLNGGNIFSLGAGQGDAGQITVTAIDNIVLKGRSADGQDTSRIGAPVESSADSVAAGNGGRVVVRSQNLLMDDGALIFTEVSVPTGNAGDIQIILTDALSIANGATINAETTGLGNAGTIEILAQTIDLTNNARITSSTQDIGAGGRIDLISNSLNLSNSSFIQSNTFGEGDAGDIKIQVNSLTANGGSQIDASTFGIGDTGLIAINAIGDVALDGRSAAYFPSAIFSGVEPGATGNSQGIEITAASLNVTNRAQISSTTEGVGNAGPILITADGNVFLLNSIIISEIADTGGNGTGGDITIQARALQLLDGSALLADTENIGDAGNITIQAAERVILAGRGPSAGDLNTIVPSQITTTVEEQAIGAGGDIAITTDTLTMADGAFVSASTFGQGTAGDIFLRGNALSLTGGAQVGAFTRSAENAGAISVTANDNILITGQDNNGPSEITSASLGEALGNGGPIVIESPNLQLRNQARITAISAGDGTAGSIDVTTENLDVFNGSIETNATRSSGGDIRVNARRGQRSGVVFLRGDGDITTDSLGNGGNILLNAVVVALDDSDILARSEDANGGNITFGSFFSDTLPVGAIVPTEGNNRVDVSADGSLAAGVITTPDTTFVENSLTQLPDTLLNLNSLVAGSCIIQQDSPGSRFAITNADTPPQQPAQQIQTTFSTGDVSAVVEDSLSANWQAGEVIMEPAGTYQLADGRLVLSRGCG